MKRIVISIIFICGFTSLQNANAQVSINTNGVAPHTSAMLDVSSDSLGVLIPRMMQSQRLAISPLPTGLLVFQTDGSAGFYYYDGVWIRLSTHDPVFLDHGDYLSPAGPIGTRIQIADVDSHPVGIYANMAMGSSPGYGAQIFHSNTSGEGGGIDVVSQFTGTNNIGINYGVNVTTTSTTQDQIGLNVNCDHIGTSGNLIGISSDVISYIGNTKFLIGIQSVSRREGDEESNYGIISEALRGSIVYGIYASASDGIINYGVHGVGETWGGLFSHSSSGKSVKLGGSSLALETSGDIKLSSLSDAFMIGVYDVLHTPVDANNISVGASSGSAVTTGRHNAFFGFESGLNNAGAWDNTFLGYKAGKSATSGGGNTFVGSLSGHYHTQGTNNTYVGYNSGYSNSTTGFTPAKNTFVGGFSGYLISSGSNNTYLGYEAGRNTTTGEGNVFIGYQAGYSEADSNKLYIHNSSSADPLIYGEFDNSVLNINGHVGVQTTAHLLAGINVASTTLYGGIFNASYASDLTHAVHAIYDGPATKDGVGVYGISTPGSNINYGVGGEFNGNFKGVDAICNPQASTGTAIGVHSVCNGTAGTRYGLYAGAYGGDTRYGVYGDAEAITSSFGIYCDGNGVYTGTWASTSDQSLKKDIKEVQDALEIVMQLRPKSYEYRRDEFDFINLAEGKHLGFIAQDLEEVLPELVGSARQPMSDEKYPEMFEFKTANSIEIIPILTKAIQEQQALIEELQEQVIQLMKEKE